MSGQGSVTERSRGKGSSTTGPVVDFERARARSAARRALFGEDADEPLTIGRYRIGRRIGAGGMGEVYQAVDPELERHVALKLVLPHLSRARATARLRREARALARLSHPNVVQIYEVGEHGGRTFLAMELLEGGSLSRWLAAEPRPWSSVLERFVAAGRGLAAAHAAGITHRDFKPDNVLLASDGRIGVADFGLALTGEPVEDRAAPSSDSSGSSDSPTRAKDGLGDGLDDGLDDGLGNRAEHRISAAGTVAGTIRYMPLEQLEGAAVDARADQFAFCVALYEGLWGCSPFSLTNMAERLDALDRDAPSPPPRGPVPRRLWTVIRRGLHRAPAQRWPDMENLLHALEAIPRRRRLARLAAVLVPTAGLLVALGRASSADQREAIDPCAEARATLDALWGPEQAQALARGFEATTLAFASATAESTREGLDDWRTRWLEEREHLCQATASARAPAEVLGLRGACLERQREHFAATVEVLLRADAQTVTRAQEQLAHLPVPTACSNDELLLLGVRPPPADQAEAVAELRRTLAHGQAERLAGHPLRARALAAPTLATAQALGYRPLLAEALTEAGEIALDLSERDQGLALLQQAVDLAEASHHDQLAARVWLDLVFEATSELRDETRGRSELRRARAASERIEAGPVTRSRLELVGGMLEWLAGDRGAAEIAMRAALAALDDPDAEPRAARLIRPAYLGHLAKLVAEDARMDEALALRREALAAAERGLGPDHPGVAAHAFALAQTLQAMDRNDEAIAPLERAASLWLRGPGAPDPELGTALLSLTQLALAAGELERADRLAHDAAATFARSLPAVHHRHGDARMALAAVAAQRGDLPAALAEFEHAAAHYEQSLGADARILVDVHENAGVAALQAQRYDEAREHFSALLVSKHPGRHMRMARAALAIAAIHDGDLEAARTQLAAAAELREEFDDDDHLVHELLERLVRLRSGRPSTTSSASLRAAFDDPTHVHHEYLAWIATLVSLTDDERRTLGLPGPGAPALSPDP
ncbi:protein kinase domain-containing protein [Paraliomyxa miuraensis]|uniref:protein kinase domain-containing protein n=1 Tax=Paraliomyxa miuraensis TaxID=376150 RepID=UPI00225704D7|nr:protein kinase [Paraliomyxa miuraensis]MCX4245138.1 protein kinase [Paraliomyxa miuraensis]